MAHLGDISETEATHLVEHFLVFGKASCVLFGENEFPIDDDIELTGLTNGQFGRNVESIFDFGRETHGTRFVVSSVTIFDFDLHGWPPRKRMVFCCVFCKLIQDKSIFPSYRGVQCSTRRLGRRVHSAYASKGRNYEFNSFYGLGNKP